MVEPSLTLPLPKLRLSHPTEMSNRCSQPLCCLASLQRAPWVFTKEIPANSVAYESEVLTISFSIFPYFFHSEGGLSPQPAWIINLSNCKWKRPSDPVVCSLIGNLLWVCVLHPLLSSILKKCRLPDSWRVVCLQELPHEVPCGGTLLSEVKWSEHWIQSWLQLTYPSDLVKVSGSFWGLLLLLFSSLK